MSSSDGGGSGPDSAAGPSGEGGSAEWRRIYDRVEALLPQVQELAADRARLEALNRIGHELSEARENDLHARLLQAEASRRRWKAAYSELPTGGNPKLTELQENDLKDSRTCGALFNDCNSEPEIQLKEASNCVEPSQNNMDDADIERDLREELRKLKQAYESMGSKKDMEVSVLLAEKEFLFNLMTTMDKDNAAILRIKEVETAQADEAARKLQQNVEELQVAAQNKDDEIGRLRAEIVNAKNRELILEGRLLKMQSLAKEKNGDIRKLKDGQPESLKRRCASSILNGTIQERKKDTGVMHKQPYQRCKSTEASKKRKKDSNEILRFSHLVPSHMMCGTEKEGIPEGALELDPYALLLSSDENKFSCSHMMCGSANGLNHEKIYNSVSSNGLDPNLDASDEDKFRCADPEFYNFDQLRDVSQFRANQIWAVYDSQGCMPRFYARIKKVKMAPKFIVHFTWLEFDPTNEAQQVWSGEELPVACGHFKFGESGTAKEANMFSHTMNCVKSKTRDMFEIYPRKGEVWALFKGWDIGWSSDAGKHTDFEYDVVQVVSDLSSGTSIFVMPLVKIKGFVSLFMQSKEATPYVILQDNTLRFSHLVPSYMMRGTETEGIPEGALELDPAALPLNLEEAFASVVPKSSSVQGQEFDTKCVGSSSGSSAKGCMRVGETAKEKNIEHSTPPVVEVTDDEEADDAVHGEFECPDSEFYEFSEIRVIQKFEPGQIWALYSDVDRFPSYYVFIKKVGIRNNKVDARWLDACPVGEEEKRLVKEELTVGCGTFRVSSERDANITYTGTDAFSHRVLATPTGRKNEFEIIPRVREIWAVYKNWRAGWTAQDFKKCEYELVEIIDHTDKSIKVQLLRKVDGYRAVFRRDEAVKTISKDEYPKFSHQVPYFLLTNEKGGKLRGCLELDPYSVPEAFLFT